MNAPPLVLYVPGMLPKPAADQHRELLWRCLDAGLTRVAPDVAEAISADPGCFDLVSWTWDFYGEYRDAAEDRADIEAALKKGAPDDTDRADATAWRRRLMRSLYVLGDRFPPLVPRLANERVAVHLRDLRRYARNVDDIGDHVRRLLKLPLEAGAAAGRPILLLSHSMGSVISWDALWQLSRDDQHSSDVSHWVTMGSPLGGNYLQRRLLGLGETGADRYPSNVALWTNIAAVGEMTALDRRLKDDFGGMIGLGLVDDIVDLELIPFYRSEGVLNPHNEYGYLMHEVTARVVADWWRSVSS